MQKGISTLKLIKSYSNSSPLSMLKPPYSGGSVCFSDDYTLVYGAQLATESSVEHNSDLHLTSTGR